VYTGEVIFEEYTIMRIFRPRACLILVACAVSVWIAQDRWKTMAAQQQKPVTVTRIYTGSDGQTHAEEMDPKLAPASGRIGFEQSAVTKTTGLRFIRRSPGLIEDWHTAPQRQYGITLSGRGEVEVAGGQKIRLEPGRIILIEDLTGKGHITRAIGTEAWTSVLVPLADQ
jgi:hypothetical protein